MLKVVQITLCSKKAPQCFVSHKWKLALISLDALWESSLSWLAVKPSFELSVYQLTYWLTFPSHFALKLTTFQSVSSKKYLASWQVIMMAHLANLLLKVPASSVYWALYSLPSGHLTAQDLHMVGSVQLAADSKLHSWLSLHHVTAISLCCWI